ncbi:hypothetical protein SKAU_G00163110 [Synaphobranchus kaupii]|uniref:Uncharacterized protein n=1 Tax=Synaphobranchus kaupii TaxID=118154 RepID=A0A9Q1FJ16_SYNKA|nr:hypothetical protein SKAU_G00163110 [Synaphobranchus kaupii]
MPCASLLPYQSCKAAKLTEPGVAQCTVKRQYCSELILCTYKISLLKNLALSVSISRRDEGSKASGQRGVKE